MEIKAGASDNTIFIDGLNPRLPMSGHPSLRDYFAAHVQADDRLVKCVRAMDDSALEMFALHPDAEREEHITETTLDVTFSTDWMALSTEAAKVARRLELEAHAIARVRYMQADAMLIQRERKEPTPDGP